MLLHCQWETRAICEIKKTHPHFHHWPLLSVCHAPLWLTLRRQDAPGMAVAPRASPPAGTRTQTNLVNTIRATAEEWRVGWKPCPRGCWEPCPGARLLHSRSATGWGSGTGAGSSLHDVPRQPGHARAWTESLLPNRASFQTSSLCSQPHRPDAQTPSDWG